MEEQRPRGLNAVRLDHLAVADSTLDHLLARYVGDLGGRWLNGGGAVGFHADQITFDGGKIELMVPVAVDEDDFLVRFLDRHGAGAHHLTFKTRSVAEAVPLLLDAGYRLLNVHLDVPTLEEAFVHPHDAFGILVQVQQKDRPETGGVTPAMPSMRTEQPSTLLGLSLLVHDLPGALRLFRDLLGGTVVETDEGTDGIELGWEPGWTLRLVQPLPGSEEADLLGDRPGRIHRLHFATPAPAEVPGALATAAGDYVVAPHDNRGVGLALSEPR